MKFIHISLTPEEGLKYNRMHVRCDYSLSLLISFHKSLHPIFMTLFKRTNSAMCCRECVVKDIVAGRASCVRTVDVEWDTARMELTSSGPKDLQSNQELNQPLLCHLS